MDALYILIGLSIITAVGFLIAFLWNVNSGQYDDDYTPSVRMLFDDEITPSNKKQNKQQTTNNKQQIVTTKK